MTKPVKIGEVQEPSSVLLNCWECKTDLGGDAAAEEHFCGECGKVQPWPNESDYFAFFRLPRKLGIDAAALEKQFHQLSWKLHPDKFHNASGFERELSLSLTAALNDARRTLADPFKRTEYLLRLEGVRKEGEVKQQAPPDLLEEVFELNEHLEELRAAKRSGGEARQVEDLRHQLEKARELFQGKMDGISDELAAEFVRWDELVETGKSSAKKKVLDGLNEILNRHNYIRNLVENVGEELDG
jgi:molecular chaperone HscB